MANAVDYTDIRASASALGSISQVTAPSAPDLDYTDKTASPSEVAAAYFHHENTIGALLERYREHEQGKAGTRDPLFNPYAFYAGDVAEKYQDLDYFVRTGHFDSAQSPEEWVARADAIRRELEARRTIARGGFAGHALGFAVSLLDFPTFLPIIGWSAKGGALARGAVFAANAAAGTATQEAILHSTQHTRTPVDSLLNIGLTLPVGFGMGVMAHALVNGHALHPDNPANPLRLENAVPIEGHVSTTGAAAVPRELTQFAEGTGLGAIDRMGYWLRIPTMVARRTVSDEARTVMNDLVHMGAPTKANEAGVAAHMSAEDILDAEFMPKLHVIGDKINAAFVAMNREAGASSEFAINARRDLAAITGNRVDNIVPEKAWNDALFRRLAIDENYKSGNALIDKYLDQVVPEVDRWRNEMADRLIAAGMITPDQRRANYLTQRWVSRRIAEDPQRWEAILLRQFSKAPDEAWLKESFGIARAEFEKLPDVVDSSAAKRTLNADGTEKAPALSKRDILSVWNDEADVRRLITVEREAEAAAEDLKRAKYEFGATARAYRKLERNVHEVELAEATATVRTAEAERATLALQRQQAQAESETIQRSIDAHIANENARVRQYIEHGPDVGASQLDEFERSLKAHERAKGAVDDFLKNEAAKPDVRPDITNSGAFEKVASREAQGADKRAAADKAAFETPHTAPKAPTPEPNFNIGKAQGRLLEANRKLAEIDRNLAKAEERLARLVEKRDAITAKADELRALRKEAVERRKALGATLQASQRSLEAATKLRVAAESKQPLAEWLTETRRALTDHTRGPSMFLFGEAGESGRVKHRAINMTPDTAEEMIRRGFLETDVTRLLYGYTRDVGSRLALAEKFGDVDMVAQKARIAADFDQRISDAGAKGDAKAATKLADERRVVLDTVDLLRDRVLGRADIPADPESALVYMGRVARLANFLRYMGRVIVSAIPDLAAISLNHGFGAHLRTFLGNDIAKYVKGMKDREVQALIFAGENALLFSRYAKNMDIADLALSRGFGTGATRKISAAIEGGLRWGSERMAFLNGMAWWNSRHKFVTGQVMMQNILADAEAVTAGRALAPHRVTEYARFGFTMDDLKQVAAMIQKHGERNEYGLIDPNGGAWLKEPGGYEAHRRLMVLLKRATDEAVPTLGIGDLPAFMSSQAGKVLAQFQSFGFAIVNKYVRNLRYKAVNGQGLEALWSVSLGLGLGTMAYVLAEKVVKGNELSDKPAVWVREAVDRSGLSMYLSAPTNALFKLSAPVLKEIGWTQTDLPSRYRQASWLATMLGPSFGLFEDLQGTGAALSQGDWNRAMEKGRRLVPFQNLIYVDGLWRLANTGGQATR